MADVRPNGEIYYVADEMANEKAVKWGGPEIDEERQQHLENFG